MRFSNSTKSPENSTWILPPPAMIYRMCARQVRDVLQYYMSPILAYTYVCIVCGEYGLYRLVDAFWGTAIRPPDGAKRAENLIKNVHNCDFPSIRSEQNCLTSKAWQRGTLSLFLLDKFSS